MQFESHLGHVFSLFRGWRASECAQTVHRWAPSGAFLVAWCYGRGLLPLVRRFLACYFFMAFPDLRDMTSLHQPRIGLAEREVLGDVIDFRAGGQQLAGELVPVWYPFGTMRYGHESARSRRA